MKYKILLLFLVLGYFSNAQKIKIISIVGDTLALKNRKSFKKTHLKPTEILKNNENTFKIYFESTAINPNYSYKLFGLESVETQTKNNYAYYTNIGEGEYTFQIKDLNNPQIKPTKLNLIIESSFWLQWWFAPLVFIFTVIIFSVIIYLIFLYRFSQKLHLQRVRDNIASDLHDDVGATLSSISFFGEMMRSKIIKNAPKEEVLPLLDKLISTSKETIETMRGVVWTINPNNDNAVDFFQKLQTFGKEMLSAKNMAYNLSIEGFENVKLPLEVQRNFFLFYKETINNIAKHSKATSVEAFIKPKKEGIEFSINDNGVGFNPAEIYEGHGLKSLRKRTEELEGSLEIQSTEGKGTTINLYFPLP